MIGEGTAIADRLARARIDRGVFERLSDHDLASLVDDPAPGWGATQQVDVDGTRAFIKRVPVTMVELESRGSTANLYGIPTYLNYPYGSPGVGVARELQFALKATQWVEDGTCTAFPILLHHRVIERRDRFGVSETTGGYTAYRGDEPTMNRYLADRARASAELVLCFEHIPHSASDWITLHPADASWIVDEIQKTIAVLQSRGIVHFDVDMFNVLTDGRYAYLADYGLVMDSEFELDDAERRFLGAHRHFDEGNLILGLGHQLYWMFRSLEGDRRATVEAELGLEGAAFETVVTRLLDAADQLDDRGLIVIGPAMRADLARYDDVIRFMHEFFAAARANWSRDTAFDDETLVKLLAAI
jgi:hypothetical protein